jgi:inosose dehydratase
MERVDKALAGRKARALDEMGATLRGFGLTLAYHNHSPELVGSPSEMETLLNDTDPQNVSLVLDAGHAFRAEIDFVCFLRTYASRMVGLHLRDFKGGVQVPLGSGEFPLRLTARTLKELEWNGWAIVEEEREDGSKPGMDAVGPARTALRGAFEI